MSVRVPVCLLVCLFVAYFVLCRKPLSLEYCCPELKERQREDYDECMKTRNLRARAEMVCGLVVFFPRKKNKDLFTLTSVTRRTCVCPQEEK